MRWRWMLFVVGLGLLLVLAAVVIVSAIVPIGFTVSAPGRVVPGRTVRATAAESGLALETRDAGPVAEGDVLLRQKSTSEERQIAALERELVVLRERRSHQQERIAAAEGQRVVETELVTLAGSEAEGRLAAVQKGVGPIEDEISARVIEQRKAESALATSEHEILKGLAAGQSVPRMEVARAEAAAATGRLKVEQAEFERRRGAETRTEEARRLRSEIEKSRLDLAVIETRIDDRAVLLEITRQIVRLEAQRDELRREVERKTVRAPWAGQWGEVGPSEDEYVSRGDLIGVLTDTSIYGFVGEIRDADLPWVKEKQPARIRLRAFPFLKYGILRGHVVQLETHLSQEPPVFAVEILLDGDGPYAPASGMTGHADIEIFRGTLLGYLLVEPGGRSSVSGLIERLSSLRAPQNGSRSPGPDPAGREPAQHSPEP
ncbi:MAG: HlyD family efflux transporter periplasmic adaptor subunit [Lentisphaerae bacterium]|jgi:multidrug resistance efflux pump|nr:HlyD family efflux transporter periplasmic adaptor subunit [Lentisphaerota bacterium]MBT5607466.1 HlyD family efflux transporter periplasmic adaptor subunit [Lentisphaerota bacterium]MBT7055746.1 HlyD family efflux transporter periplasmic adaptor subunit [Lentisphaerota bacterium]MBT7843119.1 HlyD family efflux transporter periplasmic adaptor subunit [Lentisphaerota bacterium]